MEWAAVDIFVFGMAAIHQREWDEKAKCGKSGPIRPSNGTSTRVAGEGGLLTPPPNSPETD